MQPSKPNLEIQYLDSSNLSKRYDLHARFSTNPEGWLPWVFDRIALPPNARVLELGYGPGALWKSNATRIPAGWDIVLTDFSEGMVRDAQAALSDLPRQFRFETANAQNLPFPDDSFDGIIANHMLYHVPDIPCALAGIRRALKSEGVLFAATNGRGHMGELWDLVGGDYAQSAPRVTESFELENGGDILRQFFSSVELLRYEDSLVIPDPEPLIAYLRSGSSFHDLSEDAWTGVEQRVYETITASGAITIHKSVGVFICR